MDFAIRIFGECIVFGSSSSPRELLTFALKVAAIELMVLGGKSWRATHVWVQMRRGGRRSYDHRLPFVPRPVNAMIRVPVKIDPTGTRRYGRRVEGGPCLSCPV